MLDLSKINKTAGKGNSVSAKQEAYKRQLAKRSDQTSKTVGRAVPADVVPSAKQKFMDTLKAAKK